MASAMVKTSVTIPRQDLERAQQLGINVSAVARDALKDRLRDEQLDREIDGYVSAFEEWDETSWDHLTTEGLASSDG